MVMLAGVHPRKSIITMRTRPRRHMGGKSVASCGSLVATAAALLVATAGAVLTPNDVPLSYDLPVAWVEGRSHQFDSAEDFASLYRHSVDHPAVYWAEVAGQFEWRGDPLDPRDGLKFNFDATKGPIFTEWFTGSTTNIA